MQQLLTGRTRLRDYSANWVRTTLGDAGSTFGGLVGKVKDDFGVGSESYVTFTDVMANVRLVKPKAAHVRVRTGERQNQIARGDILFNGSSETPEEVALTAIVDFNPSAATYLNSFCFGYRIRDTTVIDPTYLAYLFRSHEGRKLVSALAQGATRYNIAKTKLMEARPLLPSVDEQRAVVDVLPRFRGGD